MGLRDRGLIPVAVTRFHLYASSAMAVGPLSAAYAAQGRFPLKQLQAPPTLVLCAHLAATQARRRLISVLPAIQDHTLVRMGLLRAHLACPDPGQEMLEHPTAPTAPRGITL